MDRVLETIRGDVTEDKVRIDTPTQNLESYFLGVVQKARQSEETSGATSGNRVAAYLRGDANTASNAQDRILDRLAMPQAALDAATTPVRVEPGRRVESEKLDKLSQPTQSAPEPAMPPPDIKKQEQLAHANEKLSSLLGKPK